MHLFFDVITALNALTFGNISAAGEKEYLIAVICSCQVSRPRLPRADLVW